MPEVKSTFRLQAGGRMPLFALPDASGRTHASEDCMGSQGMVVVFACNHCPFVVHLADALGNRAREWAGLGVRTVAIVSNDLAAYPQDGPDQMKEFADRHRWEFPYLLDESQEIALAYGAACTPDFFLFDRDGMLHYSGQFDETRPKSGVQASGNDLDAAVRRMLSGGPPQKGIPASGCSIKWKPGRQPEWWNLG